MHGGDGKIVLSPRKKKDTVYLDPLFTRLQLPLNESAFRNTHGYWKSWSPAAKSYLYSITTAEWFELFGGQYGHKYSGKFAVAAADHAAEQGGYEKPRGNPQHYTHKAPQPVSFALSAEDSEQQASRQHTRSR